MPFCDYSLLGQLVFIPTVSASHIIARAGRIHIQTFIYIECLVESCLLEYNIRRFVYAKQPVWLLSVRSGLYKDSSTKKEFDHHTQVTLQQIVLFLPVLLYNLCCVKIIRVYLAK